MFVPRSTARRDSPSAVSSDPAAPTTQNSQAQPCSDEWTSINPQLTVTPRVFQKWLADSQPEDVFTSTAPEQDIAPAGQHGSTFPIPPRIDVTFKVPSSPFKFSQLKTLPSLGKANSPRSPPAPAPAQNLSARPKATSGNPQKSNHPRKNTKPILNSGTNGTGSSISIRKPVNYIIRPPAPAPVYQSSSPVPISQKNHTVQVNPLPELARTIRPTEAPQNLGRPPQQRKDSQKVPDIAATRENVESNRSPASIPPTEPIRSQGENIVSSHSEGTTGSKDIDIAENRGESRPDLLTKSIAPQESIPNGGSNDDDDEDEELEYDFDLKATKKTVNDALEQLSKLRAQKTNNSQVYTPDELQNSIKINVIRELLDWIPNIHLIALGIENTGSLQNAHKCLMYAAETIKTLDKMGNNYDLEDLEYDVPVNLRSGKNKVIKEWKNVVGYQPYGILVWIWRDLCLSILLNDHLSEESGGALVARLLDDIRSSIPLETYDFRYKHGILSFWDLFLTGGSLLTARKGTLTGTKAPNPAYWSGSFVKAKERLDHLYCVNRLNELRIYPSVDLYRTVKSIFPGKYKKEPLQTIMNECKASTVQGQIDIFVFERSTGCLERLIHDKLLQRSSKRFRDVLVAFSASKKAEAEWAAEQLLIGFEEEVESLSKELLRVFPGVHLAFDSLKKGGNVEGDTKAWFLERARAGYVDSSHQDVSKVDYRYIFAAYLATVLRWNRGSPNPLRKKLLGDMRAVFLPKLGIIFELDGWVGKVLKDGCKVYDASGLRMALEYFLEDFGFEKIIEPGVDATPKGKGKKGSSSNMKRKVTGKKRKVIQKVSRGMAVTKTKGVKRPRNMIIPERDEEDGAGD